MSKVDDKMKSSFESDSRVSPIFTFSVDWKVKSCWIFHEFLMTEKETGSGLFWWVRKSFFHIVLTTHSTRQPSTLEIFVDKFSMHEFSSSIRTTDTCKFNYFHQPNTRALFCIPRAINRKCHLENLTCMSTFNAFTLLTNISPLAHQKSSKWMSP